MGAPKGKHFFGLVTVGEKGQIVIPKKARDVFNIKPGDQLMILGDERQGIGIGIMTSERFQKLAFHILENADAETEDEEL